MATGPGSPAHEVALEHRFVTSTDGTRLHLVRWSLPSAGPDEAPPATCTGVGSDVLIIPGLGEHVGILDPLARHLRRAGLQVNGLDPRGHGDSEGRRGHVRSWSDHTRDLGVAMAAVSSLSILVAAGPAALIVLDALRYDKEEAPDRLVLISPLLGYHRREPLHRELTARILARLIPILPVDDQVTAAQVYADEAAAERWAADLRRVPTVTPRWYVASRRAMRRVRSEAPAYRLPCLVISGADDPVADPGATDRFVREYGGPLRHRRLPGARHGLLAEPVASQVAREICAWLGIPLEPA